MTFDDAGRTRIGVFWEELQSTDTFAAERCKKAERIDTLRANPFGDLLSNTWVVR